MWTGPGSRLWKQRLSLLCDFPSGASDKSWTRRTSYRSCGPTRCLQRCGTGWPPPSPSRPGPKAAERRRSPSSGASSTQCRLGSSWNGEAGPALPPSASSGVPLSQPPGLPGPHSTSSPTCSDPSLWPHPWACHSSFSSRRMFRRTYTSVGPTYSTAVLNCLKVTLGF